MPLTDAQKDAQAALRREVAAGRLTPEQAEERSQRLGITPAAPHGTVSEADAELARQVAVERGEDEISFLRRLARDGDSVVEAMRTEVDARRDWLQRSRDDEARRDFDRSPEGRQLAAARVADEAAARAALAARARGLLAAEGTTFAASDVEKLSDAEAIVAAGFSAAPNPANSIAENLAAAGETGGKES